MKKFLAVFKARNKEFFRDRSALGWNLAFPSLVVFGFAFMFSGGGAKVFKVAVHGSMGQETESAFLKTEHVKFIPVDDLNSAVSKVQRHGYDMLVDTTDPPRYWINSSSPKGYLLERIMLGSGDDITWAKQLVEGREIRYVDWLISGLLAMNMMFSCLFGVGFVIVRYRKNGVLRRLKATPLGAVQFLAAQIASRWIIVMVATAVVYIGCNIFLRFHMLGSYLNLLLIFGMGGICLISMALLISSRTASEELASGLLNLLSWPMMLMCGVWFSMDGTHPWVQAAAQALPLTHIIDAARSVMTDGAGLVDVAPNLGVLAAMSLVFMAVGSLTFRWE
jgi:ABC-type multidrug transport system permease subunit